MGIRHKLLILLLLISLIPLLAVGVGIKRDLARLGEELAARSSAVLIRKAHSGLQRIVEDHARILKREKQLLESSALFMASRVEGILYGHEHAAADQDFTPTADEVRTAREAYYFLHMHGRQNLDVDFDALETRPGFDASRGLDDAAIRGMLLPMLKRMKFRYPELMLWVDMTLAGRAKITYPRSTSGRFMREPLYDASPPPVPDRVVWSRPRTDERTRLLVFNVTAPVKDPEGKIRGEIAIVVPIGALLHKSMHLDIYSDKALSLVAIPEDGPAALGGRLKVIAQEQDRQSMRDHWRMPERDTWLASGDAEGYARMMDALRGARSGVTDMPHAGRDTLWAYAPVEPGGTSLVILVPKADVVAQAQTAKEFILGRIGNHDKRMGLTVLAVGLVVMQLAFLLSKLFTRKISSLASAVGRVAGGDFTARAEVRGGDEVGRLGQAFNNMVPELKERMAIKNALEVAQQIQQSLLPAESPHFRGHDISAVSDYCYETGGDYFDFIPRRTVEGENLVVAVGDVSDHGIPSALMMASARAYIRSHAASNDRLDDVVRRANELISDDMHQTGRFMTLFLLELTGHGAVRWVRAGHDPALLYDPVGDSFEELAGGGLPLGVIRDAAFELRELPCLPPGRIIVIGTDGIWETTSPEGVMFGKERFKNVIRANRNADAAGMVRAMVAALNEFRGAAKKSDDMTVAVVKIPPATCALP